MMYNIVVEKSTSFRGGNMLERFEKFSFNIFSIHHYLHKIMTEEMNSYGLKGPYAIYLIAMNRNESGITSAKLAEICGRNKADVSRAIADFERQNLVVRNGEKSYNAKILLTESGKNIANALAKRAMDAVFLVGGDLEPTERDVFYNTLEKISEKLEFLSEKGIPK